MGEVERIGIGQQSIEIVAADAALHPRKAALDLFGLAPSQRQQIGEDPGDRRVAGGLVERAEMRSGSVGEQGVDRQGIVAHGAVAQ